MQKTVWILTMLLCAAASSPARADRRNFAFTYEPRTMPDGAIELEYYMTGQVRKNTLDETRSYAWSHQVEAEIGVTDGFDLAMYQMFSPEAWQGYKLRARYMPYAVDELPIDFLLYFEVIHLASGDVALEERLVLGKTLGRFIVALDSMVEQGPLGGSPGYKLAHSLAMGYELAPWVTVGLETQLRMAWQPELDYVSGGERLRFQGTQAFVGPSLSLARGRLFWDASLAFRAQGERDDPRLLFRILWGIEL